MNYSKINIGTLISKKAVTFGMDARIALLIVGILGLLVAPSLYGFITKAKAEAILASMKSVDNAIEDYISDTGAVPATIDNLFSTSPVKSAQANTWQGPYLEGDATMPLIPSLTWTLENDNCTSDVTTSRYCSYVLTMVFSNVSIETFNEFKNYYANSSAITYDSGTKVLSVAYGQSKAGTYKRIKYKTVETP